jgi:hypothetical protein
MKGILRSVVFTGLLVYVIVRISRLKLRLDF